MTAETLGKPVIPPLNYHVQPVCQLCNQTALSLLLFPLYSNFFFNFSFADTVLSKKDDVTSINT